MDEIYLGQLRKEGTRREYMEEGRGGEECYISLGKGVWRLEGEKVMTLVGGEKDDEGEKEVYWGEEN